MLFVHLKTPNLAICYNSPSFRHDDGENVTLKLTSETEQSIPQVRQKLTEHQGLLMPTEKETFTLNTVANIEGPSGTMHQEQDKERRKYLPPGYLRNISLNPSYMKYLLSKKYSAQPELYEVPTIKVRESSGIYIHD